MLLFVALFIAFTTAASADEEDFAMKYLSQFHYISPARSGNHDPQIALESFQRFFHLPVTGRLDSRTLQEMHKPRCGVPENLDRGNRIRRYATYSKWRQTRLTWYLKPGRDLNANVQRNTVQRAFQYWANVTPLRFTRTTDPRRANLKLSFGYGRHRGVSGEGTCNDPFDQQWGVLAHAYFPSDGRLHFDEAESWTVGTGRGTDFLWVAVHEIGHALGLDHSNVHGAIMWPTYSYQATLRLHDDDIRGIQSLYGRGSGGSGGGGGQSCRDLDSRCSGWRSFCRNNRYVINNCKRTCGRC